MAMIDSSNILDLTSRPRRVLHSPGKNYDGEGERNLELRGIFDVLSAYQGYEGGINCSKCGKLYKSKVCFIKHLWEHSVYWDLFPGDKNHERVLAIQAALILYSRHLGVTQDDSDKLRDLLVTSPSGHDSTPTHTTPKKSRPVNTPLTPTTPNRMRPVQHFTSPQKQMSENLRPVPFPVSSELLPPVTPEKEFERPLVCPPTPRKDKRKLAAAKSQRISKKKRRLLLE
ncbi:uncharacterized protein LOC132733008 [Ruditapes philippinarum]|uniref:uncharacterized protein LOC132733008 n=1 Tax=Ruditapes philippinarum TaxID=129788 RepID=UPI00295BC20F|nr:uncharacterized protein LOC132733008 [Ruditapes philippinarum]